MSPPRLTMDINLGHILIAASLAASVFLFVSDIRIDVVEAKAATTVNATKIINLERRMDTDISTITQTLRRIEDKLDGKVDKAGRP